MKKTELDKCSISAYYQDMYVLTAKGKKETYTIFVTGVTVMYHFF